MPQASDELRKIIAHMFNESEDAVVCCGVVESWLVKRGWIEHKGLMRSPVPLGQVPREEFEAMMYLVHEWDYDYDGVVRDVTDE